MYLRTISLTNFILRYTKQFQQYIRFEFKWLLWQLLRKQKTALLYPNAGVHAHVSPIQFGALSVGNTQNATGSGDTDKESSFKVLDAYFDNG